MLRQPETIRGHTVIQPETDFERMRQQNVALRYAMKVGGHDMRSSLMAIGLLSHMIDAEPDPGTRSGYCHEIEAQCDLATNLLDTYFSMVLSPQPELRLEEVDFKDLVQQELDAQVSRMSPLRRRACTVSLHLEPTRLPVDAVRMRHAISSLLKNAFTHGAGGVVEVTLRSGHRNVRCSVRDEGSGIAADRLATLFEVPADTDALQGFGLWLARRIVESHGGQLSVTSSVGEGSEFSVTLPRVTS